MLASRLRTLQQAVGSCAMLTRSPSISAEGRCGSRTGCAMLPRARVQPILARSSCAMASNGRQQLRASGTSSLGSTGSSVRALGSRPSGSSSIGAFSGNLRSFTTTTMFAMRAKGEWIWTDEQREFWVAQVERLQRPQAVEAAGLLDLAHPLGVPDLSQQKNRRQRPASPGSDSSDEGGRTTKIPPCWELYKASKLQHPLAVALIRIGSFYEAIGLDAVMLIEHCGLNPMGGLKKDVTRAGCPQDNVVGLLKQLVEDARLDVAVWEELPVSDASYGQKATEQKERELRQLVTPEDPLYRFALERSGGGINVTPAFITGVVPTTSGLTLLDYNRASTRVLVFNGVSDDVMWGLLQRAGGGNQVVWLYEKLSDEPGSVAALQRRLAKGGVTVRRFRAADPQASFAAELKEFVGLDPATDIEFSPGVSFMEWPGVRPSYQSTLCQLGLIKTPGIPALESFLLPEGAPKSLRKLMAGILWLPPSHIAAAATRRAMRQLMSHDGTLPGFKAVTHMTADRVQLMLSVAKPTGDVSFLLALAEVLGPVRAALDPNIRSPALAQMVSDMWPLLCHQLGSDPAEMTQEWVLHGVAQAQAAISRVVADPNSRRPGLSSSVYARADWYDRQVLEAVMQLRDSQDAWSSKVKPDLIKDEVDALDKAEALLLETLLCLTRFFVSLGKSGPVNAHHNYSKLLSVKVDPSNCAIWLVLPITKLEHHLRDHSFALPAAMHPAGLASAAREQVVRRPVARDGSDIKQKTLHTCDVLDEALNLYRSASGQANAAASGRINELAQQLQPHWRQLAAAVQFSLLAAALSSHATAALRAGWTVPLVGPQEQLPFLRELERLKQQQAAAQQQRQLQQSQQELEQQEQELRIAAAEVAAAAIAAASSCSSNGNGSSAGSSGAADSGESVGELGLLQLQQLWPYWMAGSSSSTVKNDVAINGFILLTGPNMAGKSTVMRSVAAAALCGSCGLAVPAGAGSLLPLLDAVMLRTFSGDAPTDELSAFGVEMREMKFALADATQRSLVLIDELGKGTEVMSGTALSSAILRHLMHKGARGVFATHLHLLLQLLPDEPAVDFQRMDIAQCDGRAVPTWRMLPGSCTSSLALEVAEQQGMPCEVLQRARQELKTIHQLGYRTMAALGAAGSATASRDGASRSGSDSDSDDTSNGSSSSSSGARRRGRPRKIVQYDSAAAAVEQLEASAAAPGPAISEVDAAADAEAARLAEAERLQQQVALVEQQLAELGSSSGSSSGGGSSVPVRGVATGVVHHLPDMSFMPSPAHVGLGVLYVLRFPDGCFYAGQTEDVGRRRDEHERRWAKRHGGPPQMWYVVPADQGARLALESQLIMALGKGKKLRLLSFRDGAKARRR